MHISGAGRVSGVVAGVLVMFILSGCSLLRLTPLDPAPAYEKANGMLQTGNTNEAIKYLLEQSSEKAYGPQRGSFFSGALVVIIQQGSVAEAQDKFAVAAASDPSLAGAAFDIIPGYYNSIGDKGGLQAWTAKLMEMPFPEGLDRRAFAAHAGACLANGDMNRIIQIVPVCVKKFKGPVARELISPVFDALANGGKLPDAAKLIDAVEVESVNIRELKNMVLFCRTVLAAAQERWADLEPLFARAAAELPDGELQNCISRISANLNGRSNPDLCDKLCELIIQKYSAKKAAASEAALQWLNVAKVKKDPKLVASRLDILADSALPVEFVRDQYNSLFYGLMNELKKEDCRALLAVADKILVKLTTADEKADIRGLMLDGTYLVDDFEKALSLIEAGIQGRDKAWEQMVTFKLKAHIAEKNGKYQEAIESLKNFIECASKWDKTEEDPLTGVSFSREMCLGINYKRLGKWYDKAGNKEESAKGYLAAKKNFEKALAGVAADSKEASLIKTEMESIPVTEQK